jgi:hypothetical protein
MRFRLRTLLAIITFACLFLSGLVAPQAGFEYKKAHPEVSSLFVIGLYAGWAMMAGAVGIILAIYFECRRSNQDALAKRCHSAGSAGSSPE